MRPAYIIPANVLARRALAESLATMLIADPQPNAGREGADDPVGEYQKVLSVNHVRQRRGAASFRARQSETVLLNLPTSFAGRKTAPTILLACCLIRCPYVLQ